MSLWTFLKTILIFYLYLQPAGDLELVEDVIAGEEEVELSRDHFPTQNLGLKGASLTHHQHPASDTVPATGSRCFLHLFLRVPTKVLCLNVTKCSELNLLILSPEDSSCLAP